MKRILQTAIAATIAAVSAGCGTVYAPAAGEPVARLRLVASPVPEYANASGRVTKLWVRDLSACPLQPAVASANNYWYGHSPARLDMPAPPPDAAGKFYTELLIPAGKLLGLTMIGLDASQSWSCEVRTRFMPSAGMDYEVEQRWSADGRKCFIDMRTLTAGHQGVARRQQFVPLDPDAYGLLYYSRPNPGDDLIIPPPQPDLCKLPAR